jgi:hypothetical protein
LNAIRQIIDLYGTRRRSGAPIFRQVPKTQLNKQLDEMRRRTDPKMRDRALSLTISPIYRNSSAPRG